MFLRLLIRRMHNYHANTLTAPLTHSLEYSHSHLYSHSLWHCPARPMNITSIWAFSEIENRFESARIICALPPTKQTFHAAVYSRWRGQRRRQRGMFVPQFFTSRRTILQNFNCAACCSVGRSGSSKMLLLYKIIKYTLRVPRVELQRIEGIGGEWKQLVDKLDKEGGGGDMWLEVGLGDVGMFLQL